MSEQKNDLDEYPLALAPGTLTVTKGDSLVLVLRSAVWTEVNVDDIITALNDAGLGGRFVILYLGDDDEAHVVRGTA